jgi:hypothetical protein
VYEATVEFLFKDGSPGASMETTLNVGTLAPTDSPRFVAASEDIFAANVLTDIYGVALSFRDAAGQRWCRDVAGRLAAVDD